MRSVEKKFLDITKKNPYLSSYVCFTKTIKGRGFVRPVIRKWFYKLVNRDDYSGSDKKQLFRHLEFLSKVPEENEK